MKKKPRTKKRRNYKPRNYAATEATLANNRKTRRDIAALDVRLTALEIRVAHRDDPVQPGLPPETS